MADRLVRQVGGEVVARLPNPGSYLGRVLKQIRRPLIGLAAHEAVEIIEAHTARPLVERPGRAVLIAWRVVVLAEPGRGVAVLFQDRTDGGALGADDGVIAWIPGGLLRDDAEAHRVVIAPGDQ